MIGRIVLAAVFAATVFGGFGGPTPVDAQSVDCSSNLIPNYVKVQNGCATTPTPVTTIDCRSPLVPNYVKAQNGCTASASPAPAPPAPAQSTPPTVSQPAQPPLPSAPPPVAQSPVASTPDNGAPVNSDCAALDGVYEVETSGFDYTSGLADTAPKPAYPQDELAIQGAGNTCSWSLLNENAGGALTLASIAPGDWQRWLYQQPLQVSEKFVLTNWPFAPSGTAEGFIAPSDGGFQALGTFYTPDPSLFTLNQPGVLWLTWRLNPNPCGPDNSACPGLPGAAGGALGGQAACGSMDLAACAMEQQAADSASLTGSVGR
jgi:hypothetical protein